MSTTKTILNEIKESLFQFKNNIGYAIESAYYGYIRKDDYSKKELKFHLHRAFNSLTYPFIHVKNSVKNLWDWRDIIWEDRDFDYEYLYKILYKKLKNMENYFYSNDTHILDAEKYAEQIKECRILIERILNDAFHDEEFKEYYEKYPATEFSFTPCESEKERIAKGLPARLFKMNQEENEEKDKMFKEAYERAYKARLEAIEKLFDKLSKNIEYWWD